MSEELEEEMQILLNVNPCLKIFTESSTSTAQMVAKEGTEWEITNQSSFSSGRMAAMKVVEERGGPSTYMRQVETVISAFHLLLDESLIRLLNRKTEGNARKKLNNNWIISLEELQTTIAIMHA